MLNFEQTLALLSSEHRQVRMWATYQLIECWQERVPDFVHLLLESDIQEVREAAVHLIGRHKLQKFAFPLYGMFNRSTGPIKQSCALALVEMGYEPVQPSLQHWFANLWEAEELQISDLQCAADCLLHELDLKTWAWLEQALWSQRENHLKALTLFGSLCQSAQNARQVDLLMQHYRFFRVHYTDPQFFHHLASIFDCTELLNWLQGQLQFGTPLQEIYLEGLRSLSLPIESAYQRVLSLVELHRKQNEIRTLLQSLQELMETSLEQHAETPEWVCLQEFHRIAEKDWDATILKIQDQEFVLLLFLPLSGWLRLREAEVLEDPLLNLETGLRIYHSPLLRQTWMRLFLEALLELPEETRRTIVGQLSPSVSNQPKEALLRLINPDLSQEAYPFPMVLPRPWQYRIEPLLLQLSHTYDQWFPGLVETRQHEHLDYALELFVRFPNQSVIERALEHFPLLIHHHFNQLLNLIEKVPDERFIPPLLQYYRKGENAVRQLLCLLCLLHHKEDLLPPDEPLEFHQDTDPHVRIYCSACQSGYHYPIHKLYIDAELLEQRRLLQDQDLWFPDVLHCKNCDAQLEFRTDARFRSTIYAEVLTAKMLKLSEEDEHLSAFTILNFPRVQNRKCNPGIFLQSLDELVQQPNLSSVERAQLFLEAGKLYLSIDDPNKARDALLKSLELAANQPQVLYHLGVLAYHERNVFDARLYFSQLLRICSPEDFLLEEENLHQLASHYLEILDRREFKRSSFKLVVNPQET